jgi:hypothetical protein
MPQQQQEIINIGALPNDGQGDPLRVAFTKINNNFARLFSTDSYTSEAYSVGLTPLQVIWERPVSSFTQAVIQVDSSNPNNQDSQNITINAAITNNFSNIRWSGHSTLFNGTACTRYEMDVFEGNVRLMVNPLQDVTFFHFISAQVTYYLGDQTPGLAISLNGYPVDNVLATENELIISTEQ